MKNTLNLILLLCLLPYTTILLAAKQESPLKTSLTPSVAARDAVDHLPAYSTSYDPARNAFTDGAAAVALASKTRRRILVELGGDWCKWCHVMDAFFEHNPDLQQQLHETFVILKVNVSDTNDNAEFLKAFPRPLGYPHMYVTEFNGSILWSQDTAEFVENGRYNRQHFIDFFNRWTLKDPAQISQNQQK